MASNVAKTINIGITISSSLETFSPLLNVVSEIFKEIVKIDEKTQCNKNILKAILGRMLSAEMAIKFMLVHKEYFREKLSNLKYQESLHTFKNILDKIKNFAERITQLRGSIDGLILRQ
ncbi:26818_t:CDS:1 [Dentiscutata erythropus]|uniref:26818_t:CDS:1 n=1 Tax=Dentiscutata erythropus TaxID=1348616 RepID=A0A9N9A159_9GLOM|nr:26818_t:CDS:1 [Dentiscutata erythropus]